MATSWSEEIISPTPTPEHVPTDTIDVVTGSECSLWELLDEWTYTVTVPVTYVAGSDLVLRLYEATPSTSLKHKWQIVVTLFRPSTEVTDTVTVSQQYTCAATANVRTTREITLTSSGKVDTTAIAAEDLITLKITRVAANADEDPEDIILFKAYVISQVTSTIGLCYGRAATMINDLRYTFNDSGGTFVSDDTLLIRLLNRGKDDLAARGAFRTSSNLDFVEDTEDYNLATLFDGFLEVAGDIIVIETGERLYRCKNLSEYEYLKSTSSTSAEDYFSAVVNGSTLKIYPTPTAAESDALAIPYIYSPDDLGCTSNYNPDWPTVYDETLIAFGMWQQFMKDRSSKGAVELAGYYQKLYERKRGELISRNVGPILLGVRR